MKAEIKKEFSEVFKVNRFYTFYDGCRSGNFESEEMALKDVEEMKIAILNKKESEVIYTEEF